MATGGPRPFSTARMWSWALGVDWDHVLQARRTKDKHERQRDSIRSLTLYATSRCAVRQLWTWLLPRRVKFSPPALRTTPEQVSVVQQAVEHGAGCGRVSQQFAPVFHRTV